MVSNPDIRIRELINYEQFCGLESKPEQIPVKEITVHELEKLLSNGSDFQLIDVREPYEFGIANIGGELIPLSSVAGTAAKIAKDKKVVVLCRSGVRSANAIRELEELFGFENLYNLKGGILAWSKEIDASVPAY